MEIICDFVGEWLEILGESKLCFRFGKVNFDWQAKGFNFNLPAQLGCQ